MSHQSLPSQPKRSTKKRLLITASSVCLAFVGANAAIALDLGGIGGLLQSASPVISQYTSLDITKYAGYLQSATKVLSSLKSGSLTAIAGAVGQINNSLGDAGVTIPSKLAADVLNSVSSVYAARPQSGSIIGTGAVSAGERAVRHAENVSHRVAIEAAIGQEGQAAIKQSVEGSAQLAAQSAQIAQKCSSSTVSQDILKCMSDQNAITAAGLTQLHDEAIQNRLNGVTQTEILAGVKEAMDGDANARLIERDAARIGTVSSAGVFAGLAGPSADSGRFARGN